MRVDDNVRTKILKAAQLRGWAIEQFATELLLIHPRDEKRSISVKFGNNGDNISEANLICMESQGLDRPIGPNLTAVLSMLIRQSR